MAEQDPVKVSGGTIITNAKQKSYNLKQALKQKPKVMPLPLNVGRKKR